MLYCVSWGILQCAAIEGLGPRHCGYELPRTWSGGQTPQSVSQYSYIKVSMLLTGGVVV